MATKTEQRRCPFCTVPINSKSFACTGHWAAMSEGARVRITQTFKAWERGELSADDLRKAQQEVLDACQGVMLDADGNPVGKKIDPPTLREREMCLCWKRYLRQRKIYTATKEQMLDDKKNQGMLLSKIEREMEQLVDNILQPGVIQPTLFDNPPDVKPGKPAH